MPNQCQVSAATGQGELRTDELHDLECMAYDGDTLYNRAMQRLVREVMRLQHELADPRFQYAGGRIHRAAIVCRNAEIDSLRDKSRGDGKRLDWLAEVMTPAASYCEIYLAGLRNGNADATGFQVELQDREAVSGKTLREAIDNAMTRHSVGPLSKSVE